ncbi:MAG: hypothetical protein II574_08550, partial [Ruminococcus sp.]|nr:hypothetical protein [Ruminococcus sp.]
QIKYGKFCILARCVKNVPSFSWTMTIDKNSLRMYNQDRKKRRRYGVSSKRRVSVYDSEK